MINLPAFHMDAEVNGPLDILMSGKEKAARHLAALRILAEHAHKAGLTTNAAWLAEAKLIEEGALARALTDQTRWDTQSTIATDEQAAAFYESNKFDLFPIQSVEARRMGFSAQKHGAEALTRARQASALLRAGKDFGEVAAQFSDLDAKAAQSDVYSSDILGKRGELKHQGWGEGKVTEPMAVADGYEIYRIERVNLNGDPDLQQGRQKARTVMAEGAVNERMEQLMKAAATAFPFFTSGQTVSAQPAILACGQFALSHADAVALAQARGLPAGDDARVAEMVRNEAGEQIQLGELARGMDYGKRPEFQLALRYELDKELGEKAKNLLMPQFLADMTFSEERLRESYDKNFTATVDAQLEYDALVVPLRVAPGATPEERQNAVSNATAMAEGLIKKAQEGASLESLLAADAGLQWLPRQSRVVNEGSALQSLVAGLKEGQVVSRPYEDFGGYCVLRVTHFEPRHKMPYEVARNYIAESFRNEAVTDLRRQFEAVLLKKHHFAFDPAPGGAAAPETNGLPNKKN